MSDIKLDDEFKDLLPPLTEEQKEELEKDIINNGCLTPLIIWNGILIDGYHRNEICTRNNIAFDLTEMDFKDKLEAMEWAWSNQKNRRNLNKYELAQIALKFKPVIEEKAKENLTLSEGRGKKGCQKSDKVFTPIDTKKELAKIAGVSHDTIHKVEVIEEQAPEDIKKQVKAGELTINNAYVLTKSAEEAKKKNEQLEKEYQEQLKKEKREQEENEKLQELEKNLPENAVVLDKFRKPKEKHIFDIEDFSNLTEEQFDKCLKHCKKYQDTIYKVAMLHTDEDSLTAWNCILENQKEVDLELETIDTALKNLIQVQNYFKEVKKSE